MNTTPLYNTPLGHAIDRQFNLLLNNTRTAYQRSPQHHRWSFYLQIYQQATPHSIFIEEIHDHEQLDSYLKDTTTAPIATRRIIIAKTPASQTPPQASRPPPSRQHLSRQLRHAKPQPLKSSSHPSANLITSTAAGLTHKQEHAYQTWLNTFKHRRHYKLK